MRTVLIIQARMGSERLPGKVLRPLCGEPILGHVLRRARAIKGVDEIVVATSTNQQDTAVEHWCLEQGCSVYRGSENDVLERFLHALDGKNADTVMRITADCPLLDPDVCARVLGAYRNASPEVDYAVTYGYPRGLDTEVIRVTALELAGRTSKDPAEREHVTLHLYKNPDRFRIMEVKNGMDDCSAMRWTVDTAEDFEFAQAVMTHIGASAYRWNEVRELLLRHPELCEINRGIQQKKVS